MIKIIKALQPGQTVVIPTIDYRTVMRTIGSYISRGYLPDTIRYRKANVVISDTLYMGVEVHYAVESE